MKVCQFCGVEIKTGRFCGEFCREAERNSTLTDDLGDKNQLADYERLGLDRQYNYGRKRIVHIDEENA
jgi:hypothetical protein